MIYHLFFSSHHSYFAYSFQLIFCGNWKIPNPYQKEDSLNDISHFGICITFLQMHSSWLDLLWKFLNLLMEWNLKEKARKKVCAIFKIFILICIKLINNSDIAGLIDMNGLAASGRILWGAAFCLAIIKTIKVCLIFFWKTSFIKNCGFLYYFQLTELHLHLPR